MKAKRVIISLIIIITVVFGVLLYAYIDNTNNNIADTVIYGNVYTGVDGETTSEAIALKNDKIIYVGTKDGAKKYITKSTKVMDYKDGLILAGFSDTHTHVTPSFGTVKYQVSLNDGKSVEDYVKILTDYIKANPDKDQYIGRGFDFSLFENNTPTKDILDKIESEKPIFIKSADGHSGWVNSKTIELLEITKDTPDPLGGKVVKDKNGEPVGYFKDAAMDEYIKPYLTPWTVEQYKELIMEAQEFYASLGYTAYVEVFVEADSTNYNLYKAYEELDQEGKLKLRVQGAWNVPNNKDAISKVNKIIGYKEESKGGMFELTDIKIFMDGVAETSTAYLSEPYADDKNNYGADRWPGEDGFNRLVDIVELANRNGIVAHFHAIGDAAVTKALDAMEAARKRYINKDIHNVITHLEVVKESDFKRFKELDVVASADLSWGCKLPETYESVEVAKLGEERAIKGYPYKSLLDAGAVVSLATDYPAGAVPSPIAGYLVAVTRNATDDEVNVRDASQKMTVDEALKATTYGGAYQMRQETYRGTLEVGKKADLIVLDTNIMEKHTTKELETQVLLTIVDGKTIYKAK